VKAAVLSLVVISLTLQASAEAPKCDGKSALNRVYAAINKFACLSFFYDGQAKSSQQDKIANCAFIGIGATAALAGGSIAAEKKYKAGEKAKVAKKIIGLEEKFVLDSVRVDATKNIHAKVFQVSFPSPAFDAVNGELNRAYKEQYHTFSKLAAERMKLQSLLARTTKVSGYLMKAAGVAAFGSVMGAISIVAEGTALCGDLIDMYVDQDSNCGYVPVVGPKTQHYLGLPESEQEKLMSMIPDLCRNYDLLANTLETDLEKTFPSPQFVVKSCNKNGEVAEVDVKYPAESFSIQQKNESTLDVKTSAIHRVNLELLVDPKQIGFDSLTSVRASMKTSTVTRVHVPTDVLKDPSRLNSTAQRELATSLRALHGFAQVKTVVGKDCQKYLDTGSSGVDGAAPAVGTQQNAK
jgi:hypothetical protein